MLKKTITYTDYNDVERTEDFYFNLSKAEILDLETETPGGFTSYINKITSSKDVPTIVETFKKIIMLAYGVKSADGRQFIKNDEVRDAFKQTEAYSILYVELSTDADKAAAFINAIVPKVENNQAPAVNK